mmetsp:Transcript_17768/g.43873  ORF Transcript_17768/g.43873 Transcript_17768/m.43873 type:complete len:702 (+) Transcript_17768:118-2223(+)
MTTPDDTSPNRLIASTATPGAAGGARYFGEYRTEPEGLGCLSGCLGNNRDYGIGNQFQTMKQHNTTAATATTLSQAKEELKLTEDFLTSEFNKLSFQERAKALDDVHCVAPEASALPLIDASSPSPSTLPQHHNQEDWPRHPLHSNHLNHPDLEPLPKEEQDPQYLLGLFDEFESLVQKENNHLYNMATLQNPDYLKDPVLRLMFLRANLYKVDQSVKQLMSFLKNKANYFGKETLGREITLEDMTEKEKSVMQGGLKHIQAARDKSGRVVTPAFNHMYGKFDIATVVRVVYYMWFNIILRMPGAQTKGLTGVYYDNTPPGEEFAVPSIRFVMTLTSFVATVPMRYSSMHYCLKTTSSSNDGALHLSLNNSVLALLSKGFPHHTRARTKIHFGSDMELLYQLHGYGIDLKTFPIDIRTGRLKLDEILNRWYHEYHRSLQKTTTTTTRHKANDIDFGNTDPNMDGDVMSTQDVGHLDDDDLKETLSILISDDEGMEAKVIERRTLDDDEGETLLDALGMDWDAQYDSSLDMEVPAGNKGWFQTFAREFGSDGVTADHALETPNPAADINDSLPVVVHPVATDPSSPPVVASAPTSGAILPLAVNTIEPTSEDILLGRGQTIQTHPGNVRFREWLEEYRDEYERTPRHKKRLVTAEMANILSSNGIRFLKQGPDKKSWVAIDTKEAEQKISQLFRSRRKKQRE